jgi:hypothetical protein
MRHSDAWREAVSKPRPQHVRDAISRAQKGRVHQPHEGFQRGHAAIVGTEKTRFKPGQEPHNKGKGKGTCPVKVKYQTYKSNAKKRGIVFDVLFDEFRVLVTGKCVYCGDDATGIDRVDNARGYVEGNMESCCGTCNHMKWVLSRDDFIAKCRAIVDRVMVTGYEI